ncbi:hypothetical protein IM792_15505 [Mucilaginibacter sp. JRF]|uniref:hypothetical protein n=1 Tax=Mucilaginibacter sp. JRF TaxID=2780088 RepID=UPI00187E1653|nr:hypothetical protein [Mucilaginibacter sp. JRF]MBE9585862.1 hypothetical protein [Mucilaginibacter sp. JRF]
MQQSLVDIKIRISEFTQFFETNYLNHNAQPADKTLEILGNMAKNILSGLQGIHHCLDAGANLNTTQFKQLQVSIADAVISIYLIENSDGLPELLSGLQWLNSKHFQLAGEAEPTDSDLSNNADTDLPSPVKIDFATACGHINTHLSIREVRNAVKQAESIHSFFSYNSHYISNSTSQQAFADTILTHLLNSIQVYIMAISYLEPLFDKPKSTFDAFNAEIKKLISVQKAIVI